MEAKEGSPAPPQESRLERGGDQEISFLLRRQKELAWKIPPHPSRKPIGTGQESGNRLSSPQTERAGTEAFPLPLFLLFYQKTHFFVFVSRDKFKEKRYNNYDSSDTLKASGKNGHVYPVPIE